MSKEVEQFVELARLTPEVVDKKFVFWCPKCKRNTWHVLRALCGRRFEMCGECGTYTDPRERTSQPET